MRVLEANLSDLAYDADFGRVEASVTLLVKTSGQPARPIRVKTSQPLKGQDPLSDRLIVDAIRLAGRMRFGAGTGAEIARDLPIAA